MITIRCLEEYINNLLLIKKKIYGLIKRYHCGVCRAAEKVIF